MRLREADSMAAMAELRQKVAELEIQVSVCVLQGRGYFCHVLMCLFCVGRKRKD